MFGLTQVGERVLWIVILVITAIGLVGGYTWHERRIGARECTQGVKEATAKEDTREQVQHAADVVTVQKEGKSYEEAVVAPIKPAPIVWVCPPVHQETVPAAATAGPETNAKAPVRGEDQSRPTAWDSTLVVKDGRDANAQIEGLQDYIRNVCKPQ